MASDEVRRTIIIIVGALVGAAVQMILSPNALDVAKSGAVGNAGLLQKRCEPLLSSVAAQYNFPHVALTLAEYHEGLREASEVLTLSPLKTFRVAFVGSLYCHNAWEALTILEPRLAGSSNGSSTSSRAPTALEFVVTPDTAATLLDPSCEFLKYAKDVRVITGLGANSTAAFPADHFDWIFFSSAFVAPAEDVAILEDRLARWWPKLRPGGLFSGDHFNDPTLRWIFPHWGHHGPVVTAVSRFAAKTSGRLNPTQNSVRFLREGAGINRPHSPEWYMMKPSRIYTLSCRRFIVPANAMVDELPKRGAPAVTEAATSVSQQELWRLGEKTLIPTDEYDKSAPLPGGFKYGHPVAAAAPRHAKPRTTKK